MTDTQLKSFVFQVEQMRMAQTRYAELEERVKNHGRPEDVKAALYMREMKRQLEIVVDDSIRELNKAFNLRIAPEQVNADTEFKTALENNLSAWQTELAWVENQLVEQALTDAKAGQKSERYNALEKREGVLKAMIAEVNAKLGSVQERTQSPAFSNTVSEIVNNAKP